jgi:hypothetical protein
LVVANTAGCSASAEQRIIDTIESKYPAVQCYVEHRDNQPVVKMSRTARRLCGGATDTEIAAAVGIAI